MATTAAEITLSIKRPSGEDDELTEIGKVSFGAHGELTLLSANTGFQSALENVLRAVNAETELRIKVPPPPEAAPLSLFRRTVKRDEPDLLEAMCDYMEQKYDLFLAQEPAAPEAVAAAAAPAAAVVPPTPPSPPKPSPLELLRAAVTGEDGPGVKANLLALGADRVVCDQLLAAWEVITTPGGKPRDRLGK